MSIKPILFSAPMVRAIMAGRKTMTRRVIREVPNFYHYTYHGGPKDGQPKHIMDWGLSGVYQAECDHWGDKAGHFYLDVQTDVDDNSHDEIVPRYQIGDVLWVRETWANVFGEFEYRSDLTDRECEDRIRRYGGVIARWRPSIFMPRDATRLWLRVKSVRVERLQEISEEDASAEGLQDYYGKNAPYFTCVKRFEDLWDELNAKRGYGWEVNPWVWVIEFERCEKPQKA